MQRNAPPDSESEQMRCPVRTQLSYYWHSKLCSHRWHVTSVSGGFWKEPTLRTTVRRLRNPVHKWRCSRCSDDVVLLRQGRICSWIRSSSCLLWECLRNQVRCFPRWLSQSGN